MDRIELIANPPAFPSFVLTHWMRQGRPMFGVGWGASFTEFYSEFDPAEFFKCADRPEIESQLQRIDAAWVVDLLSELSSGTRLSTDEIHAWSQCFVSR